MSGHSKWATIKRQKGANDAKRGQLFTKLANAITIAARTGSDPEMNPSLRIAIEKAKGANMPKDNIDRAIQKAVGGAGGVELSEVVYEGFAPGGAAVIIEAVTDKKQRTVSEVKNILDKNGGSMAGQGAVSYLFQRSGEIIVPLNGKSSDELLDAALENGASDFEDEEGIGYIYTDASLLHSVQKKLVELGFTVEDAGIVYRPLNRVLIAKETEEKLMNLIEKLEDLDDVQ